MTKDVMEEIRKESESLYREVARTARKKWNVSAFERVSPECCTLTVNKIKNPDEVLKVKCILHNSRWFLVEENKR